MNTLKNIIIIDDHELMLCGISEFLIKNIPEITTSLFLSFEACIKNINLDKVNVAIIDLRLKNEDGFEICKLMKEAKKNIKIVIYTAHDEVWTINRLLEMNNIIDAIVMKNGPIDELVNAINKVLNNEFYVCQRVDDIKRNSQEYQKLLNAKKIKSTITKTEFIVLEYISNGHTSGDIAKFMCRTVDDVNFHRKNLMIKLEAKNVADLVARAITHRIIDKDFRY